MLGRESKDGLQFVMIWIWCRGTRIQGTILALSCNENLVSQVDGSPFKKFGQEITEIAFHLRLEIPTLPRLTRELIKTNTLLMLTKSTYIRNRPIGATSAAHLTPIVKNCIKVVGLQFCRKIIVLIWGNKSAKWHFQCLVVPDLSCLEVQENISAAYEEENMFFVWDVIESPITQIIEGLSTILKILNLTDDLWRNRLFTSGRATDRCVRFFGCAPGIMHSR